MAMGSTSTLSTYIPDTSKTRKQTCTLPMIMLRLLRRRQRNQKLKQLRRRRQQFSCPFFSALSSSCTFPCFRKSHGYQRNIPLVIASANFCLDPTEPPFLRPLCGFPPSLASPASGRAPLSSSSRSSLPVSLLPPCRPPWYMVLPMLFPAVNENPRRGGRSHGI